MSSTSPPLDLEAGRARQKLRTRSALLDAARQLIAAGAAPTVEDAAAAAAISRTTAYRYFRTQAELLAAAHPETVAASLLGPSPPADPALRLERVIDELTAIVLRTEAQQRTMLRLSLEPRSPAAPLPLRQGRAIGWIEEALAPLRETIPRAKLRRLVLAIRTTVGIEALVWLTDVAGLSREQAVTTMRWSASALLRAAIDESTPRRARARSRARRARSR
jgi:AcrR family transcriptional regulator